MKPHHLKDFLQASPFVPFSLVLATGRIHRVGNPDVLNVTVQGHVIHEDATGPMTVINPLLIAEIIREPESTGG
jgi:hypothetical protein